MNEQLILVLLLAFWILLITVLGRATYRAVKNRKWPEIIALSAVIVTILILTGGWVVFFGFMLGCSVGLPLPCTL